jgi:hypothetical protein
MSLESEAQALRIKAAQQWRELAHNAAAGDEPSLAAVSKLADTLGIADAVVRLRADAEIVRQVEWYASHRDATNARIEAVLAPYGDEPGFRAAVEQAEAHARGLRESYNALVHQTMVQAGTAEGTRRRLEGSRPDLFNV